MFGQYREGRSAKDGGVGAQDHNHHPRRSTSIGMPKNNSENCLTIQVPSLFESDNLIIQPRNAHSSPVMNGQRRRYSQGAILVPPHFSVLTGQFEINSIRSTSSPTPPCSQTDLDYLRHSTENLRDSYSDSSQKPFASTIHLLGDRESSSLAGLGRSALGSQSSTLETRRKVSRTPHERLHKLAKRHWPEDNLIPLDDICESPLVKTPNEPAQWSAGTASSVQQHSTSTTLFDLDSVSASLQLDKG